MDAEIDSIKPEQESGEGLTAGRGDGGRLTANWTFTLIY